MPDWNLPKKLKYPVFIPLDIIEKIRNLGKHSALAKQFLPRDEENATDDLGLKDPIGDHAYSPTPQLIHRYPNRVLFLPTTRCPIQCRYCFRKNELHQPDELFKPQLDRTLAYLKDHREIEEIIFSGGDPFIIDNKKLESYFELFSSLDHIKTLRFHTRFGSILPQRFDEETLTLLKKAKNRFKNIVIVFHLNHKDEISPELIQKIRELRLIDIELFSQSVLLKNVNDSSEILAELFTALSEIKIRPYYLHHPDLVTGAMHFYLSLEQGRKIYLELRKKLSGWMIPQYMLDIPGGHGKVWAYNPHPARDENLVTGVDNRDHFYL